MPLLCCQLSSLTGQHLPHGDLSEANTTLAQQLRQADACFYATATVIRYKGFKGIIKGVQRFRRFLIT